MKLQEQTLLAQVRDARLRRMLIFLWGLILAAQCVAYIIKFPAMINHVAQISQGAAVDQPGWTVSSALIVTLVGTGAWIYMLANSVSTNPPTRLWVRALINVLMIFVSIGLCLNALTW